MIVLSVIDQYLRLKARTDWRRKPATLGNLKLGYVENYGAFKGFMKEHPKKVLKYQAIFVVCCIVYTFYVVLSRKNSLIQMGWLLSGIGGLNNLWDRALNGYVTDYLSLNGKLYFNIADVLVFAGVTISFLGQLFAAASKPKKEIIIESKEDSL